LTAAAARTHAGRLVERYGEPIHDAGGGLTHLFPTVEALTRLDGGEPRMPGTRKATLLSLCRALADGTVQVEIGADWDRSRQQLGAVHGVDPWTVESIAMRALGDPDAFPVTDLGVRLAATRLGLPDLPQPLTERSTVWRPWRAYAVQHLWATVEPPINDLPSTPQPHGRKHPM
jgi:AraC family transcriptional regulator of adaptative response / DNA-3-methyladenine glycosylase II